MSFDIVYLVVALLVILLSMTLHEAMHGFVAYWLGDTTAQEEGRLTLNPIKHIDPFLTIILPIGLALVGAPIFGGAKPVPLNLARVRGAEWGAALVAVAGPLTNLVIAFVFFGVWVLAGTPTAGVEGDIFTAGVSVNLGFFIFNMIPIPPLDGSRVLYALAPEFIKRGFEWVERYGVLFVFIIVLVGSSAIGKFIGLGIAFFIHVFGLIFGLR
jgi:Zn-dependent protease